MGNILQQMVMREAAKARCEANGHRYKATKQEKMPNGLFYPTRTCKKCGAWELLSRLEA